MPNLFAFTLLLLWPFVILYIFKKLPPTKAVIWSVLISYMVLPVSTRIDLPVLPPIDKNTLPPITILIICLIKFKDFKLAVEDTIARRLMLLFIIMPVFTIATNDEVLRYGETTLPALKVNDLISISFQNVCEFIAPLLIGRHFLRTTESHRYLLIAMLTAFAYYAIPILWEIRFSPQLHRNIYGFFPGEFRQQMREGGFRPVVFMGHGLLVAFFVASALCAAIVLKLKNDAPMDKMGFAKLGFIAVVLVISKTVSALIYGFIIFLAVRFLKPISHVRIAAILAITVLAFPMLRSEQIFPTEELVEYAKTKSEDRAQSLEFRFDNEDMLLEKAMLRKYFGWGSWGRNRIYDPISGKDISVTDGIWIIVLGMFGYMGFFSLFGLYCYVIFNLYFTCRKKGGEALSLYTSALCLLYAINLVDLLPNSSLSMMTMLIGGGLLGYAEQYKKDNMKIYKPISRSKSGDASIKVE